MKEVKMNAVKCLLMINCKNDWRVGAFSILTMGEGGIVTE